MRGTFHVEFSDLSLGSFGACCKISDLTVFKRLLTVFIQFQANFVINMPVKEEYRV